MGPPVRRTCDDLRSGGIGAAQAIPPQWARDTQSFHPRRDLDPGKSAPQPHRRFRADAGEDEMPGNHRMSRSQCTAAGVDLSARCRSTWPPRASLAQTVFETHHEGVAGTPPPHGAQDWMQPLGASRIALVLVVFGHERADQRADCATGEHAANHREAAVHDVLQVVAHE